MANQNYTTNDSDYRTEDIDQTAADLVRDHKDAEKVARDCNTGHDSIIGGGIGLVGGAVVGGLAGGPVGAVIGAVIGGVASDAAVGAVDRHDHDGSPDDTGAGSSTGWTDPSANSRPFQDDSTPISNEAFLSRTVIITPVGPGYGPGSIGFPGEFDAIVDANTGQSTTFRDPDSDYDEVQRDIEESERITERIDSRNDRVAK